MTTPLQFLAGAKALQGEGASLPVQLSGSLVGEGTATAISIVDDGDGNGVLRVVDAAPFAYDAGSERLKVQSKRVMAVEVLDVTPMSVAAAASNTITVTPPAGEVWRVKLLGINVPAPSGAASGTHRVELYMGPSANVNEYMMVQAVSTYSENIRFRMNTLHTANSSKTPSDATTQIAVITSIVISADVPLHIKYTNGSDVTNSGNWTVRLIVEKETVDS